SGLGPRTGFSLLQRCADRAKGPAELGANALHGNNNSNRDSGGNQTVFDCCGPGFVFEKCQSKRLHGGSQSVFAASGVKSQRNPSPWNLSSIERIYLICEDIEM